MESGVESACSGRAAEHLHQRERLRWRRRFHLGLAAALGAGDAGARGRLRPMAAAGAERVMTCSSSSWR